MARPLSGHVEARVLNDGQQAFYVKIRSDRHLIGRGPEWSLRRAERFMDATLLPAAKLKQPWWALIPMPVEEEERARDELTFWKAADEWIKLSRTRHQNPKTRESDETPVLKHLLPFFAHTDSERSVRRLVTDIDEPLVRAFVERKRLERVMLGDIADKLAEASDEERQDFDALKASEAADLDQEEIALLWRYGQQGGRYKLSDPAAHGRISLSSRGLSEEQINGCLTKLSHILDRAARQHGIFIADWTKDVRLRPTPPARNWLTPVHLQALVESARSLDSSATRYAHNGREAAVWVLALCGPRVHEFCGLNWRDLSAEGLRVRKSKTAAGVRTVQVPRVAREALERHRERLGNPPEDSPIWPSAPGSQRGRGNVARRLLAPVVDATRSALESSPGEPLPLRITPHTFRRTAVTYWYWAGRGERNTMYEIGHRTSRLTLEVYAQPRPRDPAQTEMLTRWMEGIEL